MPSNATEQQLYTDLLEFLKLPKFWLYLSAVCDPMESEYAFGPNPTFNRWVSPLPVGPFNTVTGALEYHDRELLKDAEGKPTSECIDRITYSFRIGRLRRLVPLTSSERDLDPGRTKYHGVVEIQRKE